MKFIDDKGRLFGKINVIDFLVILFLSFLVPMFYFSYKIVTKKPPAQPKEFLELNINCNLIKLNTEALKLIAVEDKEIDIGGNPIGKIIRIGEAMPFKHKLDIGSSQKIEIEDRILKQLPVELKIIAEVKNDTILYNGQKINIGVPFTFRTNKYIVEAIPDIEIQPDIKIQQEWIVAKVKFSAVSPEINKLLTQGYLERDSQDRIIGKFKKIISINPSQVQALKIEEGKFIFVTDPYRNDVVAVLEILCTKREGSLYFKEFSVKVGTTVTFVSELYIVSGEIIGIERNNVK